MTTKTKIAITAAAACTVLGAPLYLQRQQIRILEKENESLRSVVQLSKKGGVIPRPVERSPAVFASASPGEAAVPATPEARKAREASRRTGTGAAAGSADVAAARIAELQEATKWAELTRAAAAAGVADLAVYEDSLVLAAGSPPLVAGKVNWDHRQATGPPDTTEAGDIPTAWAPLNPKSGEQWLGLEYDKAIEIKEINIHETHNPGAVSRVAAVMPDGKEKVLWEGRASPVQEGEDSIETSLPVPRGTTASQIKVYVDTNRVESWPEIDAVELVGTNGSRQWASKSSASSSYSQRYGHVTVDPGTGGEIQSPAGSAEGSSR